MNYALPGNRPMLITLPCSCERAQEDARRENEEVERAERIEAFSKVWSRSDVPERFLHVNADFERAKPLFAGKWLYLYGENGRGKTYAACQAAKAYLVRNTKREVIHDKKKGDRLGSMRCGTSFHFTEAQSLLSEVTSSWSRWDMNEEEVKERWAGVALLILDDLGKGVPSEWAAETLFDISTVAGRTTTT
jgi:DNA replication protein DnaC